MTLARDAPPTIDCPSPAPGGLAPPSIPGPCLPPSKLRRPGENRRVLPGQSRRRPRGGAQEERDGLGWVDRSRPPPLGQPPPLEVPVSRRAAGAHSPPSHLHIPSEDQDQEEAPGNAGPPGPPPDPLPPYHAFPTQNPISHFRKSWTTTFSLPTRTYYGGGCWAQLCRLCTAQGQTHLRRRHLHPRDVCVFMTANFLNLEEGAALTYSHKGAIGANSVRGLRPRFLRGPPRSQCQGNLLVLTGDPIHSLSLQATS